MYCCSIGINVHMIGCINSLGPIHHEIKRISFCREDAMQWIRICFGCINSLRPIHHEIKRISFCREDAMQWIRICLRNVYSPTVVPLYRRLVVVLQCSLPFSY